MENTIELTEKTYPVFKTIMSFISEGFEKSQPIFIKDSEISQAIPALGITAVTCNLKSLFGNKSVNLAFPEASSTLQLMDSFGKGSIYFQETDEGKRYRIINDKYEIKVFRPLMESYSKLCLEKNFPGKLILTHNFMDKDIKAVKKAAKALAAKQYTFAIKNNELVSVSINDQYFLNIKKETDPEIYKVNNFFPFPSIENSSVKIYEMGNKYFIEYSSFIDNIEVKCFSILTKKMYNIIL